MMKLVSYYYIENKNKMALKKKKEKKSICMYKLYEVSKKIFEMAWLIFSQNHYRARHGQWSPHITDGGSSTWRKRMTETPMPRQSGDLSPTRNFQRLRTVTAFCCDTSALMFCYLYSFTFFIFIFKTTNNVLAWHNFLVFARVRD